MSFDVTLSPWAHSLRTDPKPAAAPKRVKVLPRPTIISLQPVSKSISLKAACGTSSALPPGLFKTRAPAALPPIASLRPTAKSLSLKAACGVSSALPPGLFKPTKPAPAVAVCAPPPPSIQVSEPESPRLRVDQATSPTLPPELEPRPRDRLMISNPQVAQFIFGAHPVLRELTGPLPKVDEDASIDWGRDARVTLPTGEHLIPYEFPLDELFDGEFRTLLPSEEDHFHREDAYGRGFLPEYRNAAIAHAKEAEIPVKVDTGSCIEGGNCRIFEGGDGKPKALVGWNSVLLTLMALERQGKFKTPEFQEFSASYIRSKKRPTADSIRIARNRHYFKLDLARYPDLLPDTRTCIYPPTFTETVRFRDDAIEFEAMLAFAKARIALDLDIPSDRIAFLLQDQFHIDMSCFTGTGDAVFLHDPFEAISLLESLRGKVRGKDAENLETSIQSTFATAERLRAINAKNIKAIEKIGCKAVLIAGDFRSRETRLNFMNSLFLVHRERPVLLTNGTCNRALNLLLKAEFLSRVEEACPDLEVVFIADQTSVLQNLLHEKNGGLHCVTFTSRAPD